MQLLHNAGKPRLNRLSTGPIAEVGLNRTRSRVSHPCGVPPLGHLAVAPRLIVGDRSGRLLPLDKADTAQESLAPQALTAAVEESDKVSADYSEKIRGDKVSDNIMPCRRMLGPIRCE